MNILNTISTWHAENQKKRIAKMQSKGLCPDCKGNGFHTYALNEFAAMGSMDDYHCAGCNGSGLYKEWESRQ